MARKPSQETTIVTPAQADAAEVRIPASLNTGPGAWARGVAKIKSGAFVEGRKNNYGGSLDPTAADDQTQNYGSGSLFLRTSGLVRAWLASAVPTGAAIWHRIAFWDDISDVGKSNLAADLDPPPGTMFTQDALSYPSFAKQDYQIVDCAGNLATPRVTISGSAPVAGKSCHWKNCPGGQKPDNAIQGDTWEGPLLGGRLVSEQGGSALTLGPALVGKDIRGINVTKLTITLAADSVSSYDVDVPFEVFRKNAVIELRAGAGATINGVANARLEINAVNAVARVRKDGPNSWWVEMTPFITELEAGATFRYPVAFDATAPGGRAWQLVTDGGIDYYDVTLTGIDVSGNVSVDTVDLTVKKILVVGPGGGGARVSTSSAAGGASGGQVDEQTDVLLAVGNHAFSFMAPGAEKTSTGNGNSGTGPAVFKSTSCTFGVGGRAFTPANNGYHGGGAPTASTNTTDPAGGTGTSGRNGGNGNGTNADVQANRAGGGGAGAGGPGGNATDTGTGGPGGDGFLAFDGQRYGCGSPGTGQAADGTSPTGIANYGSAGLSSDTAAAGQAGKPGCIKFRILASDLAGEPEAV
jgi:hypothetical protein